MAFPNTLSMVFSGNIDSLSTGKCNALKPSETISASCAQTWWLSWQAIITLVHVWCTQRASEDRSPVFWNSLAPTQQNALPLKRSSLTESSESTSFESLNQSEDRIASEARLKMLSELPTPYCSSKPSTSFWISKSLKMLKTKLNVVLQETEMAAVPKPWLNGIVA